MKTISEQVKMVEVESTAWEKYAERKKSIDRILNKIKGSLAQHDKKQGKDRRNWGFAGDLGNVESKLSEVLTFLGGSEK